MKWVKKMGSLLLAIAGGYLLLLGLMFLFQNKLLFMPSSTMFQTPKNAGLIAEDLWITTEDGVRIHGWYFPNESAELVVILSHGNAGNISGRIGIAETLHSPEDEIVNYKQGRALYEMIDQPKMFVELRGGHNDFSPPELSYNSTGVRTSGVCVIGVGLGFSDGSWQVQGKDE